ncbi:MAG TPA: hypothetical protein VH257_24370 [Chloroflexota bacterium]|nr:hypothetical protein [Chloroflexota bacterium]
MVTEGQRVWRVGRGAVLNERFWIGAVTAAQAVNEVKERGDPILKG